MIQLTTTQTLKNPVTQTSLLVRGFGSIALISLIHAATPLTLLAAKIILIAYSAIAFLIALRERHAISEERQLSSLQDFSSESPSHPDTSGAVAKPAASTLQAATSKVSASDLSPPGCPEHEKKSAADDSPDGPTAAMERFSASQPVRSDASSTAALESTHAPRAADPTFSSLNLVLPYGSIEALPHTPLLFPSNTQLRKTAACGSSNGAAAVASSVIIATPAAEKPSAMLPPPPAASRPSLIGSWHTTSKSAAGGSSGGAAAASIDVPPPEDSTEPSKWTIPDKFTIISSSYRERAPDNRWTQSLRWEIKVTLHSSSPKETTIVIWSLAKDQKNLDSTAEREMSSAKENRPKPPETINSDEDDIFKYTTKCYIQNFCILPTENQEKAVLFSGRNSASRNFDDTHWKNSTTAALKGVVAYLQERHDNPKKHKPVPSEIIIYFSLDNAGQGNSSLIQGIDKEIHAEVFDRLRASAAAKK